MRMSVISDESEIAHLSPFSISGRTSSMQQGQRNAINVGGLTRFIISPVNYRWLLRVRIVCRKKAGRKEGRKVRLDAYETTRLLDDIDTHLDCC